jgi:thiol-disulfide isomerase/thioredoxin
VTQLGWVRSDAARSVIGDYQGKVLVLDFYATWCEPCRKSIPELIQLRRTYQSQGLAVVGLNVGGPDDRIKVGEFSRELKIDYELGFPDKALTDVLLIGDQSIPQTFVFDRGGSLTKRFIGYSSMASGELEKSIQAALANGTRPPLSEKP